MSIGKWAGLMLGLFALGNWIAGCAPTESDSGGDTPTPATPTETPDVGEPVALSFTVEDVFAECQGTTDSDWQYFLYNLGEASAEAGLEPYVTVYDYSGFGYPSPSEVWTEAFTLEMAQSYMDGEYVAAQDWEREITEWVATFDEQVEDTNTIFQCQNLDFLTFKFCAVDAVDYYEYCVAIGKEPATQCPECAEISEGL